MQKILQYKAVIAGIILIAIIGIFFTLKYIKPKSQPNYDKENLEMLKSSLNLNTDKGLSYSVWKLNQKNCKKIDSISIIKEEDRWKYFTIINNEGKVFFADCDNEGYIGTILSKENYDNIQIISKSLKHPITRSMFYSGEKLKNYHMGKLTDIKTRENNNEYSFINDNADEYIVKMSNDGIISYIENKDGKVLMDK